MGNEKSKVALMFGTVLELFPVAVAALAVNDAERLEKLFTKVAFDALIRPPRTCICIVELVASDE